PPPHLPNKRSGLPPARESRPVGAETYREKRFLEILRPGFPLLWE
ncbi:pilus assembly protein PilS, partial [Neisseria gonorrhoeae]